jgi:hypothetical protein
MEPKIEDDVDMELSSGDETESETESETETESESEFASDESSVISPDSLEYALLPEALPGPDLPPLNLPPRAPDAAAWSWTRLTSRSVGGVPESEYVFQPPELKPGQTYEDVWSTRMKRETEMLNLGSEFGDSDEDVKPEVNPFDWDETKPGSVPYRIIKKEEDEDDAELLRVKEEPQEGVVPMEDPTALPVPVQHVPMAITRLHQASQRVQRCYLKWDFVEIARPMCKSSALTFVSLSP